MTTDQNPEVAENRPADQAQQPPTAPSPEASEATPRPRILIGSQRNPEAYRPKPAIPVVADAVDEAETNGSKNPEPLQTYEKINADAPVVTASMIEERLAKKRAESGATENRPAPSNRPSENRFGDRRPRGDRPARNEGERGTDASESEGEKKEERRGARKPFGEKKPRFAVPMGPDPSTMIPVPNLREKADDVEAELAAMFQAEPLDDLMASSETDQVAGQEIFEDSTKVQCRIVSIQSDFVFVELGARDQGIIPLKQFNDENPAEVGKVFDGVVVKYNKDDGLYEVSLPLAAAEVGDWSSVSEGMIVETKITGLNKGGLECEVGKLRGFLPLGQIATFRVENPEQFIGERWKCLITEVNPLRRNLIVSRRALMEKENEEKREQILAELEVGQTREGTVRKIIDVGAFVDLGGVDGFIHVSQMSWGRVNHPSEVVKEGDVVKVTVQKIDEEKNRISLSLKDKSLDPWNMVSSDYQEGESVSGRVTSIMPFGAFVELAPGVEGLVHISEISWSRVNVVSDALSIGDHVNVKILSIDPEKRKMSLSIKQLKDDPRVAERAAANAAADAERTAEEAKEEAEIEAVREKIRKNQPKGPLKGGVETKSDGAKFGLNW